MIDIIDNISAYFDDDIINIIYKDLKSIVSVEMKKPI